VLLLNRFITYFLFSCTLSLYVSVAPAQSIRDSTGARVEAAPGVVDPVLDSINRSVSPKKAAIRSAIIPGWGQAYVRQDIEGSFVRKYWKIPVIYGAIGTSAGIFAYNLNWYRRTRFAFTTLVNKDTANFDNVHTRLQSYIRFNDQASLQYYRNEFRRNVDYSVLFFILMWGLNVVDATVDAHLKSFDVSPDLGFKIQPGYSDFAGTNGVSIIFTFK
jgi:hypothetical protein